MKALKALVATMGVLIVIGIGLLAWAIFAKPGKPTAPAITAVGLGTIGLGQPDGSHIAAMENRDGRLFLQVVGGGADRVVMVDPGTGRVVGTLVLTEPSR